MRTSSTHVASERLATASIFNKKRYKSGGGLGSKSGFLKRFKYMENDRSLWGPAPVPLIDDTGFASGTHIAANRATTEYQMKFVDAIKAYAKLYNEGIRLIPLNGKPVIYRIPTFEENPWRYPEVVTAEAYVFSEEAKLAKSDISARQWGYLIKAWSELEGVMIQSIELDNYGPCMFHVLTPGTAELLSIHAAASGLTVADQPVERGRLCWFNHYGHPCMGDKPEEIRRRKRNMNYCNEYEHPWGDFETEPVKVRKSKHDTLPEIEYDDDGRPTFGGIKSVRGGAPKSY